MTDPVLTFVLIGGSFVALLAVRFFKTLESAMWDVWATPVIAGLVCGVIMRFTSDAPWAGGILLTLAALYVRLIRANMMEVANEDYVRTARAKGLNERTVIYKHVLKNGLIPVVTILGLQLGVLLAGAIITEKIFNWPGIGLLLVEEGINRRDYRLVQGCVLVISVTYIFANTLTDMVYRWLDPRIRVS